MDALSNEYIDTKKERKKRGKGKLSNAYTIVAAAWAKRGLRADVGDQQGV